MSHVADLPFPLNTSQGLSFQLINIKYDLNIWKIKREKKNLSIDLVVNARCKTIARINNSDNEISMPWNFYFKKEMKKTKESHTFKKRNYKVYIPFIAP